MTTGEFRELALSFAGTEDAPHFDRTAFKVIKKRIFATLHEADGTANVKLSPADQTAFCGIREEGGVYPVPNKWGQQGWTTFELAGLSRDLVFAALESAYRDVIESKPRKK